MTPRLTIYIAGRYSRRLELLAIATWLESKGVRVTSRWLEGLHENIAPRRCAEDDLEDIQAAQGLLFFAENEGSGYQSGGRHVELGAAFVWQKWIWIIGEPENVFHHLSRINVYPTVAAWVRAIAPDVAKDLLGAPAPLLRKMGVR
jgi:hypothetical protein